MSPEKVRERRVTLSPDGNLRIEFPYDRRLVALVKGLPGREWKDGEKFWSVPKEHASAVVELLAPEGFAIDPEVERLSLARRASGPDHLTVGQLNRQAQKALLGAFPSPVWVVGEISGFAKSAHKRWVDFQLVERDSGGAVVARVDAVLSPEDRQNLEAKLAREGVPFRLEDEVQVRVLVTVDLRTDWGRYQVALRDIDVAYTLGEVARRREEILRKLAREGLLERNRALPFPDLPLRVGLVTSLGSDAYHDVLRTFRESGYAFRVTVHGARVQGPSTEPSVLAALEWFRERAGEFDVVLICRGGGSRTDLAWFDSEALGRAVAGFPLPVVVGIGHEEDRCVLDEVGWRQKTPTAAAAFLVERVRASLERVEKGLEGILTGANGHLRDERRAHRERALRLGRAVRARLEGEWRELGHRAARLRRGARGRVLSARERVDRASRALPPSAARLLGRGSARLQDLAGRLVRGGRRSLASARGEVAELARALPLRTRGTVRRAAERVEGQAQRLHALDPRRVVERGYAVLRLHEGRVVTDPAQAPPGARLRAELRRGVLLLRSEGEVKGGERG